MPRLRLIFLLAVLLVGCYEYEERVWGPITYSTPTNTPPGTVGEPSVPPAPQPKADPTFLSNGIVRVGIDLARGGAITFLAPANASLLSFSTNMVNNYDLGRQIQASFYSGPSPYVPPGAQIHPAWSYMSWNPIQSGDVFGNGARVLDFRNDSTQLYVKTEPTQWALNNVRGQATFETWISLKDNAVHVRCRLTNNRPDKTQYAALPQELPAVYLNAPYYRIFSYNGLKPFTNDALSRIQSRGKTQYVQTTENWVAMVNEQNWGLGVWQPDQYDFVAGTYGPEGTGFEYDFGTANVGPTYYEILDHNIVYEYTYALVLGNLEDIRKWVYQQPRPSAGPNYRFVKDRQHWHFYDFGRDTGWPIEGEINLPLDRPDILMTGPGVLWDAASIPKIYIRAAFKTDARQARFRWRKPGDPEYLADRVLDFPIIGDGEYRTYELDMSRARNWNGQITVIGLEPALGERGGPGKFLKLQAITTTP